MRCARRCPTACSRLASEIELIDLPPDDLIQRLRQGKVYMPEQAGRAIAQFLLARAICIALRELAMRIAAERVDAQMVKFMRAHAIRARGRRRTGCSCASNESPVSQAAGAHRRGAWRSASHAVDRALCAHAAL